MGQSHDEGVQFVLEDNLLNHLLASAESTSNIHSLWLFQAAAAFYERALSAPYVPLLL